MANPLPCQACLEVADAEFMVSNRLGVPWPFEQSTVALCVPCFINVGISMGTALQAALAEMEGPSEPGVLEAIEADEGEVRPAPVEPKRRPPRKAATATLEVEPAPPEEAPASDE